MASPVPAPRSPPLPGALPGAASAGAASGAERCGNFPSCSTAWLAPPQITILPMTQAWVGQVFRQDITGGGGNARACWGPGFLSAAPKGGGGVQGSRWPSGQSLRPRPLPAPPASAQACSSRPLALLFPCLSLWAAPSSSKNPSREFVCCHKIMQMCFWGGPGSNSLCLPGTWRGRAGLACVPRCPLSSHPP